ncbi:reverse transcriptase-like protein [Halobacillus locisalis]|uniref:Reverse transcriptase-like protein n=1 Tax=Halobacillus locisalis TaxID=220753 RepID=A0A838CR11_9BACI|nr:reverse transcriptase-like protein [Halobacillus locisalis]MBA2174430.1 reverse transcriptase-like protein [Halobacillus locisalis]
MKVKIEWMYKKPKGPSVSFSSDEMNAPVALIVAEDLERTGRVKDLQFIDSNEQRWSMKEMKKFSKGIQKEPHNAFVYFDGGYDLGDRRSGLGCVIYYEQNQKSYRLRVNSMVEQLSSNNEAEYAALHFALQELDALGVRQQEVTFAGDSQVVIKQLTDEWPVMEEELSNWADRVENRVGDLGIRPIYEVLSRKKNKEADRLATQALNGVDIRSTVEYEGNHKNSPADE